VPLAMAGTSGSRLPDVCRSRGSCMGYALQQLWRLPAAVGHVCPDWGHRSAGRVRKGGSTVRNPEGTGRECRPYPVSSSAAICYFVSI
jgi:hypothetical protein